MNPIKACGVIVFRKVPEKSFLLMRHHDRWDFPKGHVDPGESEIECALRELAEETGIKEELIELDQHFRFELSYQVKLKKYNFEPRQKTLVMFLGTLDEEVNSIDIQLTEHIGYEWMRWSPPHSIQNLTIDPVINAVETFFNKKNGQ